MIVSVSDQAPEIQGLILLDCWGTPNGRFTQDKFYVNLIDNVQHFDVRAVINSAGRLKLDLTDDSISNVLRIYGEPPAIYNPDAIETIRRATVIQNILAHIGDEETSPLIKKYLLRGAKSVLLVNSDDFVYHYEHHLHSEVKNWLIAGQAWGMCTHNHFLGIPTLASISKQHDINFYATDYSFYKMTGDLANRDDFHNDFIEWQELSGFGYRLVPGEY